MNPGGPITATVRVTKTTTLPAIILAEFAELPGMRLTMPQVCRLWGISPIDAQAVVARLIERGLLSRDSLGRVYRPDDLVLP
jgi:DNA-binding IclR family transcriptional regulator